MLSPAPSISEGLATPRSRFEPILRPQMPELDSLRGVAILLVLFCHGYFWSNGTGGLSGLAKAFVLATWPGWLGVNLFFVLSGFLITGILLDSKPKEHYFRHFYIRRALRILPAYYGILMILYLIGIRPRSFLLLSFFYLSNVTPLFGVVQAYPVLWSLAVEEHFYLLWPSVVYKTSSRVLEYSAVGIACLVPVLRLASYAIGWRMGLSQYTWLVADGLTMGAWLALYVRKPNTTREKLAQICMGALGIAVLATLMGAPFGIWTRQKPLGAAFQESCGNLAFLGLIGLTLLVGTGPWKTLVRRPILEFYGKISYGLYLIHLLAFAEYDRLVRYFRPHQPPSAGHFLIMTMRFLISVGCATGLAYLSRRYFEERFLRMKERFGTKVLASK
jgi:peptidoglycan/LPS O-acetylase OafA/YrhL